MIDYEYKIVELIGKGTSGEIYSALNADGDVVALKIYQNENEGNLAKYEYDMACAVECKNILKPIDFKCVDGKPTIVLPYCKRRSADGLAGYFDEKTMWRLMRDVASALSCLHEKCYGHFDVKPSNILVGDECFLLSDFGSCRRLDEKLGDRDDATATDRSSFRFEAPERIFRKENDMWSLGATVFYLFMGCHVFGGLGGRAQKRNSMIPRMRMECPELSNVVRHCLAFEPSERPTANEIAEIAENQYYRCCHAQPEQRRQRENDSYEPTKSVDETWPEEM